MKLKQWQNLFYDCDNSTTCNSNEKWNNETYQCECKNYCICKKDYSWKPNTYSCENSKYLKSDNGISTHNHLVCK